MRNILDNAKFLKNMWEEFDKIQKFRRPSVLVLVVNVEFAVNLLLMEYGKKKTATEIFSLEIKAKELLDLKIIEKELFSDLKNLWKIRNVYAHDVIFDKNKAEKNFKMRVNGFKCLQNAVNTKRIKNPDIRFGKCCYYLLARILDKYMIKVVGKKNINPIMYKHLGI